MCWHEAFVGAKGPNFAKVLALLDLATGEDYTYNMVKQFRNTSVDVKALRDPNQLQPILKSLEEMEFLTSKKVLMDGRERKYYSLNPQVLRNPDGSELYHLPRGGNLDISEEDINNFLKELGKKDRELYLNQWTNKRGINKYDYITFLITLEEEAYALGKSVLVRGLDAYISEIQRLERESRRERTLSYAIDAIIRCNDPMKCPDSNCRICAGSGIKTRWDQNLFRERKAKAKKEREI